MKKLIFLLLIFENLFAHPHYFLDTSLIIDKNLIKNIWKFDALNSKILFFDFDKNKNRVLDSDEKEQFLNAHFYNLKDNNYNIVFSNKKEDSKIEPRNIDVIFEKKRLYIVFEIPFILDDETIFCTMDQKIYLAYKLEELKSDLKIDVEKSEFDFCLGVNQ